MENRPFDHILGCMVGEGELPGAQGINGTLRLWTNNSHTESVNVTCGTAPYVCKNGGNFDNFGGFFPPGSNASQKYPYGGPGTQSLDHAYANGARPAIDSNSTPIAMFSGDQLPVKRAIVRNFGTFNRLFSATPTNSQPNHMFTQSGTSCGLDVDGKDYLDCGGILPLFPQRTIYDSLVDANKTIGIYTHWKPHAGGSIGLPDAYMDGVLRHADRVFNFDEVHSAARTGNLPHFSWFIPPANQSDHPCNDVRHGEDILKQVYESLRASPRWNRTLLFVAYDDSGML